MQLQFLQDLENLSLDGEAFLAQFLEFLLDRSLDGDTRFDSLIPSIAQVLDLKLPITTITSSFALLQVYIRQNKGQNFPETSQNRNQPMKENNFEAANFAKKVEYQSEKSPEIVNNLVNNSTIQSKTTSQNEVLEMNLENQTELNLEKKYDNSTQGQNLVQEISTKTTSSENAITEKTLENETPIESKTEIQNQMESELKVETELEKNQSQNPVGNIKTVTLSQVNTFLIRQIEASNETSLKLLLSDLAIAKIDTESKNGILTLSSGALLNFLKTKRSLDWIANTLENEFGWKLHLTAQQRESKTVLFESTDVLVVAKNYAPQNIDSYKQKEKIDSENKPHSTTEKPKIAEKSKPEEPRNQETKTQTIEGDKKPENEPKTEPKKIFYTLFWPSKNPIPYNLSPVPTISKIDEPTSLDWEDLISDFEIE